MASKALENRIYLDWSEASEVLEMDSEGLRQALLYRLSPAHGDHGAPWLPLLLPTSGDGFMSHLTYDALTRAPSFQWNGRDTFYSNTAGELTLTFSDGTELPLHGSDGRDSWSAHHGYGHGFPLAFTISGDTLTVSPDTVRQACSSDGYVDSLSLAPRAWCKSTYPFDFCFHVYDCGDNLYTKKPGNLVEAARFLREDVMRVRSQLNSEETSNEKSPPPSAKAAPALRSDTRENLLRIIRALYVKANWPEREAVGEILQLLGSLGFTNGPSDDTIRKFLNEARSLEPDSSPK